MTALTTPRGRRLRVRLIAPVMPALRVLRALLRYLAMTVTGFAIGIALALALPLAFDARPLVVLSGSMEPALATGDVSVVRSIAPLDARPGDIVTFRDPDNAERLITHRVRAMHVQGDAVVFRTRGDANNVSERWRVPANGEIGRLMYRIPKLGWVLNFARSKGLFVLLLGGALALLLVIELTSIWRPEEDDGDHVA
jgi:signal peptidase I